MYVLFLRKKLLFSAVALFIVGIMVALILRGYYVEQTFNKEKRELPIYSVKTDEKKIAISFDCAWGVDYTDKLLEIMQAEDIKCTFFTVEFWTKKHPDYIKKISDMGHEIGTHSSTHPKMSGLNKQQIEFELNSSASAITEITGKKVELFRPPFGDYNNLLINTALDLGLYVIQWDVDSLDWKDLSATEITKRVTSKVKNGSIVLFHNQGKHTASALPEIIKTLKNSGYQFVPIGELIYKDNFYIDALGTQVKNS